MYDDSDSVIDTAVKTFIIIIFFSIWYKHEVTYRNNFMT